jgi:hypothetical protein
MQAMRWRWLGAVGALILLSAACGDQRSTEPAGSPTAPTDGVVSGPPSEPTAPTTSEPARPGPATSESGASEPTAVWTQGPRAPIALTEVAAATHRGRIWVAGGLRGDGSASGAVFVFDPGSNDWAEGPGLPEPIHHAALVSDGDALWLVGGYVGGGFDTPTAAVRRLDDGATEWLDDRALPEPRAAGAAAWDGSAIVYAGGVEPGAVAADVFAQRDHGWDAIGRLSTAREHLAAASDGMGRTLFLGGRAGGLDRNLATVDLVDRTAVRALDDLPTPRGGVAAFWWPNLGGCLVGGESPEGTNSEVECTTVDGQQTRLASLGVARHGLGAVVLNGSAWVMLGGPEPGLFVSDVVEIMRLP